MSGQPRANPGVSLSFPFLAEGLAESSCRGLHEWYAGFGGSETVALEIVDVLDAEFHVLYVEGGVTAPPRTRESAIAALRSLQRKQAAVPLTPFAWRVHRAPEYSTVVTSSHALGHTARLPGSSAATYLSYVHTPARYVWTPELDEAGSRASSPPPVQFSARWIVGSRATSPRMQRTVARSLPDSEVLEPGRRGDPSPGRRRLLLSGAHGEARRGPCCRSGDSLPTRGTTSPSRLLKRLAGRWCWQGPALSNRISAARLQMPRFRSPSSSRRPRSGCATCTAAPSASCSPLTRTSGWFPSRRWRPAHRCWPTPPAGRSRPFSLGSPVRWTPELDPAAFAAQIDRVRKLDRDEVSRAAARFSRQRFRDEVVRWVGGTPRSLPRDNRQ